MFLRVPRDYPPAVGNASPLIVVVDDEAPVRTMLRRALRLVDYEVALFASGEEFMDSLSACPPACVVLDIHMSGLSGLDVARRMRAQNVRVPIVLITASDDSALDGMRRTHLPHDSVAGSQPDSSECSRPMPGRRNDVADERGDAMRFATDLIVERPGAQL